MSLQNTATGGKHTCIHEKDCRCTKLCNFGTQKEPEAEADAYTFPLAKIAMLIAAGTEDI